MDNEVLENMKNHIRDSCKLKIELVPPGCHHHRRNAAEVAIHNFKTHFLSTLAGEADDFSPSLWDRLLPQTEKNAEPPLPIKRHANSLSICPPLRTF
jgi:hypothetical protein